MAGVTMAMPFHLQKIAFERSIKRLAKDYPRLDTKVAIADQDKWSNSMLTYYENLEGLADYLARFRIPRAVIITTIDEEAAKEEFSEKEALLAQIKNLMKETPALKPSLAKLLFEEGVEEPEVEKLKAEIADLGKELAVARIKIPPKPPEEIEFQWVSDRPGYASFFRGSYDIRSALKTYGFAFDKPRSRWFRTIPTQKDLDDFFFMMRDLMAKEYKFTGIDPGSQDMLNSIERGEKPVLKLMSVEEQRKLREEARQKAIQFRPSLKSELAGMTPLVSANDVAAYFVENWDKFKEADITSDVKGWLAVAIETETRERRGKEWELIQKYDSLKKLYNLLKITRVEPERAPKAPPLVVKPPIPVEAEEIIEQLRDTEQELRLAVSVVAALSRMDPEMSLAAIKEYLPSDGRAVGEVLKEIAVLKSSFAAEKERLERELQERYPEVAAEKVLEMAKEVEVSPEVFAEVKKRVEAIMQAKRLTFEQPLEVISATAKGFGLDPSAVAAVFVKMKPPIKPPVKIPVKVPPVKPVIVPKIELGSTEKQVLAMAKALRGQSTEEIMERTVKGFKLLEQDVRKAYEQLEKARLL